MMNVNESSNESSARKSRRSLLKTTGALLASLTAAETLSADPRPSAPRLLYVGGYGLGIYTLQMDTSTGKLSPVSLNPAASPSWLCFNKAKTVLYAINEVTAGTATAYRVNGTTGGLTLFSSMPCAATADAARGPAHASVHASGKFLLTSQYGGASIGVLPINADGSLGSATDTIVHTGDLGPNQTQAHPHMTISDPSGKYIISQDLGQDRTYIYSLNTNTGKLSPGPTPFVNSQPGSGPRHVAFHPDGVHMYSICELGGLINVYFWNANTGSLLLQQTISTLPQGYAGRVQCSEVQVAADGDTVYGGNRGFDSIVAFSVRDFGASLAQPRPSWTWTRGQTPRHFTLDPTGNFLLSANQDSNNIATFSVNGHGDLKFEDEFFANPKPACILFL